jgi:methanogenic corrinoid protein MtbC1
MKELLTPKQVGRALGVSEASVKRWCDRGLLSASRTAGGHRRLPINGVIQFLRQRGHPIAQPEVLGLPPLSGRGEATVDRSVARLSKALKVGDDLQSRQIILNLYLARRTMTDICDRVIAPAFHGLGDAWQHGEIEVYQERRGCEITLRILHELQGMLPDPLDHASYALGGTLESDYYTLPNAMVELTLREQGWLAESHGCGNPADTLAAAIHERRPRLFWLSASTFESPDAFLHEYRTVQEAASAADVAIAVGGRALTPELRRQMTYSAYGDNLRHLAGYVDSLPVSKARGPTESDV